MAEDNLKSTRTSANTDTEELTRTNIEFILPEQDTRSPMDDQGFPKDSRLGYDDNFKKLLHSKGIYYPNDLDMYDTFYRYPRLDPYNYPRAAREYVFFVKPDLFIFQDGNYYTTGNNDDSLDAERFLAKGQLQPELEKNGVFRGLVERGYAKLLSQLQYSLQPDRPFINLLSNRKSSNLDLSPLNAESYETGRNFYGTKIDYRRSSEPSDEGVEFAVEFEDTKYLEVYMLFRAYDEYERLKWYGKVHPPRQEYIWYKCLHDQFGVYKFIVDDTNENIMHWSQWWGVYPTNVPRDTFSNASQEGNIKFTINFRAQFVEDMNPATITDFNKLASRIPASGGESPTWNDKLGHINGENVHAPYIESVPGTRTTDYQKTFTSFGFYKLLWRDTGNYAGTSSVV